MIQYRLSEETKELIARRIGLSVDQMTAMSADEIDRHIEKKIGKKLKLDNSNWSITGSHDSVYLSLGRLLYNKIADKYLARI